MPFFRLRGHKTFLITSDVPFTKRFRTTVPNTIQNLYGATFLGEGFWGYLGRLRLRSRSL
jgi:hypothetical protein